MKKLLESNIIWKVLAFIIAVCLWVYVVGVESPIIERTFSDIPITVDDQSGTIASRGLSVISGMNNFVTVTVSGRRYDMSALKADSIKAYVDPSFITGAAEYSLPVVVELPKNRQYELVSKSVKNISVRVDYLMEVTLPVTLKQTYNVENGYMVGNITTMPSSIKISGPRTEISKISSAIAEINIPNLSATQMLTVPIILQDSAGNELEQTYFEMDSLTANVSIPVMKIKTVPLAVEYYNFKTGETVDGDYSVSPSEIIIAGEPSLIDNTDEIVLTRIDVSTLLTEGSRVYPITMPFGITSVSGETEATASIYIPGYVTEVVETDLLLVQNTNETQMSTVLTNTVSVRLRGYEEDIEKAKNGGIVLVVDLEKQVYEPGIYRFRATPVFIDDSLTNVKILNEMYEIEVEIKDKTDGGAVQ